MSDTDSLMTPAPLYAAFEARYGRPALDPCWHPACPVKPQAAFMLDEHYVAGKGLWYPSTMMGDGLALWDDNPVTSGWVWLNPPYSNAEPWLARLADACRRGVTGVALVKADTSTRWWQRQVWGRASAVGFLDDRQEYTRTDAGRQYKAPFPSALVFYGEPMASVDVKMTVVSDWQHAAAG